MKCGCKIMGKYDDLGTIRGPQSISWCNLHAHAGELLEALKDVLHHGMVYENGQTHEADVEKAKKAIQSAEGTEK